MRLVGAKENFGMIARRPVQQLSGLRAFEAAARLSSLARAAEELRVTPTAVGQHIRALEQYLGVALFRRVGGGVTPTEAALTALPDLRDGFDRLAAAVERLRAGPPRGIVTVTVSPSFAAKWLLPRVDGFRSDHPSIDLRLDVTERMVDFSREDPDIGVRYGSGRYPGLMTELLLDEEVFPVCSPTLAGSDGHALREPGDLVHHTVIHDANIDYDTGFPTWRKWFASAGISGLSPAHELHLNSSFLATQAALAGQGVLLGRSVIVADDLAAGRLVRPFGSQSCSANCAYYVVHRAGTLDRAEVAAFRGWILSQARVNAMT